MLLGARGPDRGPRKGAIMSHAVLCWQKQETITVRVAIKCSIVLMLAVACHRLDFWGLRGLSWGLSATPSQSRTFGGLWAEGRNTFRLGFAESPQMGTGTLACWSLKWLFQ